MWPTDFSKIRLRPGGVNYIYNILTGYHYKAPYGMDVPKGKHFNPYFDHMIIGMPRQLVDGLIDYDDGIIIINYDYYNYYDMIIIIIIIMLRYSCFCPLDGIRCF